jgi:uncharacterized damage-inducible protein DinB
MDKQTLLAAAEFSHARLIGILDTIEKAVPDTQKVLAWRPGPGRAHIAWQVMHLAATFEKYVGVFLKGGSLRDEALVANFGGGSTPSDTNVPSLLDIRQKLAAGFELFKSHIESLQTADFSRTIMAGKTQRTVGESIILLSWHEAHHQGQIHLTWNLYKQAHNLT